MFGERRRVNLENVYPEQVKDCIDTCSKAVLRFVSAINNGLKKYGENLPTEPHFFSITTEKPEKLDDDWYHYSVVWAFPLSFVTKPVPALFPYDYGRESLENILWFQFKIWGDTDKKDPSDMQFSINLLRDGYYEVRNRALSLYDGNISMQSLMILSSLESHILSKKNAERCVLELKALYERNHIGELVSEAYPE
jgi:hypothetical protein